jgi:hypothetical protein
MQSRKLEAIRLGGKVQALAAQLAGKEQVLAAKQEEAACRLAVLKRQLEFANGHRLRLAGMLSMRGGLGESPSNSACYRYC